jgi:hypothetical protein
LATVLTCLAKNWTSAFAGPLGSASPGAGWVRDGRCDGWRALEAWSGENFGMLGRSPDHLASTLGGMMIGIEVFERHGAARAAADSDFYHHARERDLFVRYVIQNPQADRSKSAGQQQSRHLVASVVDEDNTGITIRGAKMLGTSAIMSDELFAANNQPLSRGEEDYAVSFAVPMATRGLRLLSRKSYEAEVREEFDYPLSARYDENDAVVHLDDVKVPWDRVFVYRDTDVAWAVARHADARLPELPVAGAADGEDALPRGPRPPHRRDQRHRRHAAGARQARPPVGAGLDGRGDGARHGGRRPPPRSHLRALAAAPLRRAGARQTGTTTAIVSS